MLFRKEKMKQIGIFVLLCTYVIVTGSGCGVAIPLPNNGVLGDATIDDGGERTDGTDIGVLYPVTNVFTCTSPAAGAMPGWTYPSDYPFTGPLRTWGQTNTDSQWATRCATTWPVSAVTYPVNNYALGEAHLIINTSRDSSDTEGILVDGVFTGRPPVGMANSTAGKVTDHHWFGNPFANPVNQYYMSWSLAHYAIGSINTFDLRIRDLLTPTTKTEYSVVSDGVLEVVTGDDSPVYQGYLVLKGYTLSKSGLTCTTDGPYTFQNNYVHDDGNSVGTAAFTGTVETPYQSTTSVVSGFKSIEYNYDGVLPQVTDTSITLTTATITLTVSRNTDPTAIVVSGVGLSEAAFNRTLATTTVEAWEDGASYVSYLNTFLSSIPTTGVGTAVTLDLNSLLGATRVKTLLKEGRLNISFAGGFRAITASNNTSARTYGTAVNGPQLNLSGTYTNNNCEIPNDATSPLSGTFTSPPEDGNSPVITNLTCSEITSNSMKILWITHENSDSQVLYGVGNTDTSSTLNNTDEMFHTVTLTGLQAYKYYYIKARSADPSDNVTLSGIKVCRTLR